MATYGKIEEFDRDTDTWELYIERLNFYFEANRISNEDEGLTLHRAILLSSVGRKSYKLMCDLIAPEKPGAKLYTELCTMVKNHFNPKPSESVQRHNFNNRFCANGESISDFVAALRHLAEHCNFGGSLENMLRDRLVSGVNNEKIQRRLLSEGELTFKKAFEIALSLETTAQHMADMHLTPSTLATTSASVKKLSFSKKQPLKSGSNECYRCGKDHPSSKCRFKDSTCYYCKKKGHIAAKCLKKARKSENSANPSSSQQRKQRVHALDAEGADEEQDIYPLFAVSPNGKKTLIW